MKTREVEEAAHRAKQLQALNDERAVITNEQAALDGIKRLLPTEYNARIAALEKRAVQLDQQATVIPQHCTQFRSHPTSLYSVLWSKTLPHPERLYHLTLAKKAPSRLRAMRCHKPVRVWMQ